MQRIGFVPQIQSHIANEKLPLIEILMGNLHNSANPQKFLHWYVMHFHLITELAHKWEVERDLRDNWFLRLLFKNEMMNEIGLHEILTSSPDRSYNYLMLGSKLFHK